MGGMGLIHMQLWNKAAVAKLSWDLAHKEDKLWIKWVHNFYIKGKNPWSESKQASWMIRKIMNGKHVAEHIQQLSKKGSLRRQIYLSLIGEQHRIDWKCLMFKNVARPKAYCIMWLMLHKELPTTNKLTKWGMVVSKRCVMCQNEEETIEHLVINCQFAIRLIMEKIAKMGATA
ncbi:hypothetical protein KY290_013660 [Solanum tuberosum]|uniref:Reverse transcriptase zinc-binding domain-containing protein n=1 Tax=Solanum tuberosum TaxID=4113 RepID=A0ABQ7VPK8_SOLTU|nr:hypothetical protein KY290_013660 [Solanum tuberosum]